MDIKEAIVNRHSVRQYKDEPIAPEQIAALEALIRECNEEGGLRIQLIQDDPDCFKSFLASYGKFKNVRNYIALVGPKSMEDLDEKCGYYGQKIVLEAQMMGLNTCWVGGTYAKGKCSAERTAEERLVCVISIGYGQTQGTERKTKPMSKLCDLPESEMPEWFKEGVKAAMLAPTAINQQSFRISLEDGEPVIIAGRGVMIKIALGIVKYNFEAASGHKCR